MYSVCKIFNEQNIISCMRKKYCKYYKYIIKKDVKHIYQRTLFGKYLFKN